jgi:predicted transcriptional regulator
MTQVLQSLTDEQQKLIEISVTKDFLLFCEADMAKYKSINRYLREK